MIRKNHSIMINKKINLVLKEIKMVNLIYKNNLS